MINKNYLVAIGFLIGVAAPLGNVAHADTTQFTFIVGSDPQPWRLNDMPGDQGDPNSSKQKAAWSNIVNPTYSSMSTLGASFAIINGDMTEYGRESTWNDTTAAYGKAKLPVFWGLGNHDYENNVDDCVDGVGTNYNNCAANSLYHLSFLLRYGVTNAIPLKNQDMLFNSFVIPNLYGPYKNGTGYHAQGSLSYSFEYGGIHFVQLNNYPDYSIPKEINNNMYYYFSTTSALGWLDKDLRDAQARGQKIILNYHIAGGDSGRGGMNTLTDGLKRILSTYKVSAIFAGHWHEWNYDGNYFNNIPLFVSDAIFHGGYYKVSVDSKGMTVAAMNGVTGKAVPVNGKSYRVNW